MIKQQKNYKKLFSISAITICSALFSANAAIAQNVELYGVIDYGYSYRFDRKIYKDNASYAKTNSSIDSGISDFNRIGLKATENLTNDLSVIVGLERGFNLDNGVDRPENNTSYIALQSQKYGTISGGRINTPYYLLMLNLDPFQSGTAGEYNNIKRDIAAAVGLMLGDENTAWQVDAMSDPISINNAISYVSPSWSGFSFNATFSNNALFDDSAINNAENTTFYSVGALLERQNYLLGINYYRMAIGSQLRSFKIDKIDNILLGGKYTFEDFHNLKLSAFINYNKIKFTTENLLVSKNTISQTNYLLGAELPLGKHVIKASFNYSHNDKNQFGKAFQLAAGYEYYLSKRSNLFAAYSYIKNDKEKRNNDGSILRYGRFGYTSDASNLGLGYQQALQFGIRHSF